MSSVLTFLRLSAIFCGQRSDASAAKRALKLFVKLEMSRCVPIKKCVFSRGQTVVVKPKSMLTLSLLEKISKRHSLRYCSAIMPVMPTFNSIQT